MAGGGITRRDVATMTLSVLAIGVVVAAAGGRIPAGWLPALSPAFIAAIPHLNVAISLCAIATIAYGWRSIRRRRLDRHRAAMIVATGLFSIFLVLYLYRLILLGGPASFGGPPTLYRFVYLPVLTIHILLAMIAIPLVFDALAIALTTAAPELARTRHPRVGRVAATLWIVSFSLGIVVYVLLHWL